MNYWVLQQAAQCLFFIFYLSTSGRRFLRSFQKGQRVPVQIPWMNALMFLLWANLWPLLHTMRMQMLACWPHLFNQRNLAGWNVLRWLHLCWRASKLCLWLQYPWTSLHSGFCTAG
ncbi:hypothetical protein HN51_001974 [Arachis hypogaea]